MSVRNIVKGYISTGASVNDIDNSKLLTTTCNITGAITSTVACTFNTIGNIVMMTIGQFVGVVTQTGYSISINLPNGYYPRNNQTQIAVFQAYDSTGTTIGPKLGYLYFNGHHLDCFLFDGNYFVPGTANQGSQSTITVCYVRNIPVIPVL
jgi:hypothetical protein